MPIFEFQCEDCCNQFETIAKRDEQVTCPNCQSKNTRKLLSKFGIASEAGLRSSKERGDCGNRRGPSCSPT